MDKTKGFHKLTYPAFLTCGGGAEWGQEALQRVRPSRQCRYGEEEGNPADWDYPKRVPLARLHHQRFVNDEFLGSAEGDWSSWQGWMVMGSVQI